MPVERILKWLELSVGKFYDWCQRYGQVNHHNGKVPRDFWLHGWEKQRILDFQLLYPQEGYRRLTYMMIDADIVAEPVQRLPGLAPGRAPGTTPQPQFTQGEMVSINH
ncbi:MAG: hypothetical protein U0R19_02410 [Bryobacteraceae bacterium]